MNSISGLNGNWQKRFWPKVQKTDGCWPWTAKKDCHGYGHFWLGKFGNSRKEGRAHRISWMLQFGDISDGLCVLHKCDNPGCVRPDHLFLGSRRDNVADMVTKGRQARGDRSGSRLHPEKIPRGSNNGQAKLTEKSVCEARKRYASGNYSYRQLAAEFKMNFSTVRKAVVGKTWKHVTVIRPLIGAA